MSSECFRFFRNCLEGGWKAAQHSIRVDGQPPGQKLPATDAAALAALAAKASCQMACKSFAATGAAAPASAKSALTAGTGAPN